MIIIFLTWLALVLICAVIIAFHHCEVVIVKPITIRIVTGTIIILIAVAFMAANVYDFCFK